MVDELRVEVMAVRWSGDDFAVIAALTDDGEEVTLTGPLAHVTDGETLDVGGQWREHPKHGRQFHVQRVRVAAPTSTQALISYLSSVKHVGPMGAAWLVERHGASVLDAVDADPGGRLGEVPGIGKRKLPQAIESWERRGGERAVRLFLDEHGVPAAAASRLIRALGPGALAQLREDPYAATEVEGIGFATADALARAMGVPPDAPARLEAGIVHALHEAENDGHCHLPRAELEGRAARFLGTDVGDRLDTLLASGRLVEDEDRVVEPVVDAIERRLARNVRGLLEAEPHLEEAPDRDAELTDEQWLAVQQALTNRLSVLTGGPGTGKCLRGDTPVVVNGDWRRIEAAWQQWHGTETAGDGGFWSEPTADISVPAIDDRGRIVQARVTRLFRQSVTEQGRRVELVDGSAVVMTAAHRVLGPNGWTASIGVGDLVCVPRRIPYSGNRVDVELVELLAWQIAEGHERRTVVSITQKDVAVLERIRDLAARVGQRYGLRMNSMPIVHPANRAPSLRICSVDYRRFLEARGYAWGNLSAAKRLPEWAMRSDERAARVLLRTLFAAEGSVSRGRGYVEITSASVRLMGQIGLLLRRFGVHLSIREKQCRATNGAGIRRTYWVGSVSGPALRRFAFEVGFADPTKEMRLFLEASRPENANRDIVPAADLLVAAKAVTGLSRHFFGLSSSYFTDRKQPSRHVARRTLTHMQSIADGSAAVRYEEHVSSLTGRAGHRYKDQNRQAFATLDAPIVSQLCDRLQERIDREVSYVAVKRVEPVALDGWVYDFEVEGHHNYVAGGMLTHNTTSMRALVDAVRAQQRRVRLCAPTGKAARRLSESTGAEATTIHRLLEWSGEEGGFTRDEDDPIPGADLLVVDEASMLSLRLADALFRAVGPRTHVLLVGDADQLPPVGAGRVLDDLLESGAVPAVRLTEIFRQARRSLIVRAAHAINHGEPPPTRPESDEDLRDFFLVQRDGARALFDEAVSLASERLPKHYDLDPVGDVQVLSPMHRGPVGIEALNTELRARLNPDGEAISGTPLRVGDRVVQTVNDHERELMNGETGVLLDFDKERERAILGTDDGRRIALPVDALGTIRLAYCMSIHKAQGSSAPVIVVVLDAGHHIMLTRNLLYTAVTRAEQVCVVVAHPRALATALRAATARTRYTRLAEMVTP